MVEIHEPTRLTIVIEAGRERVWQVVQGNPQIERLVRNRWVWLACINPESGTIWELRSAGFVEQAPEQMLPVVAGESAAWYQGKRGFVPPATVLGRSSIASNAQVFDARPSA
jgi:hypothetical protein